MACPGTGPCGAWDLDLSCYLSPSGIIPDPCLLEGAPVPQPIIDEAKLAASQLLWAMTGRQFSCCTTTIRPCRKKCDDVCCVGEAWGGGGYPWIPVMLGDGSWTNISCDCRDGCSCTKLSEIRVPSPVCSIDEVVIDGVIVDPTTYRVDNFNKLVRLGSDVWPSCNDLTKEDTEIGTWSVTLTYGNQIPEFVRMAAAEMAFEIIKNCTSNPNCKLPQRLQTVTRQGTTMSFLDSIDFLKEGFTGLSLVDLAVRTYNPRRLQRRPTVVSPDSINQWRVTTWRDGDPDPSCT